MNILEIIFPKRCLGCGQVGKYFCDRCKGSIKHFSIESESICPVCERSAIDGETHPRCRGRYAIDGVLCLFKYHGMIRQGIKEIKYNYKYNIIEELLDLIPPTSYNLIKQKIYKMQMCIIPVPLFTQKLRHRGFNQSELIGKNLAVRLNCLIDVGLVSRVVNTRPQAEIKHKQDRINNIKHPFLVIKPELIKGKSFLVVDDVFTTGATMRSLAHELKKKGAKIVWGLTVAR